MRGALAEGEHVHLNAGFIPAGAGSTEPGEDHKRDGGDHPRRRGEHDRFVGDKAAEWESSPQVRRAQNLIAVVLVGFGIIPAGAGAQWQERRFNLREGIIPAGAGSTTMLSAART